MTILIVGCGWVGTFVATNMLDSGHRVWATCTSAEKAQRLGHMGIVSCVVDFDKGVGMDALETHEFDLVIISVPITHKDPVEAVTSRFEKLLLFLESLSFKQVLFFGSVGIYPKVSAAIAEDTFAADDLDPKLLIGESLLRARYPTINILRLGGLFGFGRIMAKYFVDKVCEIGYQTANFVHVEDIYGIICAMVEQRPQGKTYNVVCPEHPLKKEVITVSAKKYGFGLPLSFLDADKTAKMVSPDRLIVELGYRFRYASPLEF